MRLHYSNHGIWISITFVEHKLSSVHPFLASSGGSHFATSVNWKWHHSSPVFSTPEMDKKGWILLANSYSTNMNPIAVLRLVDLHGNYSKEHFCGDEKKNVRWFSFSVVLCDIMHDTGLKWSFFDFWGIFWTFQCKKQKQKKSLKLFLATVFHF